MRNPVPFRLAFAGLLMLFGSAATGAVRPSAPPAAEDAGEFRLEVADVMKITGAGTLLFGEVASGRVATGDTVCVTGVDRSLEVAAIEQYNKVLTSVAAGEPAGLLFTDLDTNAVAIGSQVRHCD